MEYLTNVELLMLIGGLAVLIITYLGYKGIIKSKGLPDNPIVDATFEQTKDVLVDKIKDEIEETKQEIAKKKESQGRPPLVPPSDLKIPMPEVKSPRRSKTKINKPKGKTSESANNSNTDTASK